MQWSDFDLDGKLKTPAGYYLAVGFLLRAYLLWVVSLTYSEDRSLIISFFYAHSSSFILALTLALPIVFYMVLFSLKNMAGKGWYKKVWRHQLWVVSAVFFIDLAHQIYGITHSLNQTTVGQMLVLISTIYLTWYWLKSKKIRRFLSNWIDA
jgi:F0F1-type ATP synthase membrane subunit a